MHQIKCEDKKEDEEEEEEGGRRRRRRGAEKWRCGFCLE